MRDTTKALISHYVDQLDLSGQVLEIGGQRLDSCAIDLFREPRFSYHNLDLEVSDIPDTIAADITDCRDTIADESFDIVVACDVFEHIDRPWLAAAEISRMLKPGGLVIANTLFAWRNPPGPVDYWTYLPESLEFLFSGLECLEKGYDQSEVERGTVYLVGRKGPGTSITRFQDSDHPLARSLRRDLEKILTDPEQLPETEPPAATDPLEALRPVLTEITDRLVELEKLVEDRIGQLDSIDARSRRLERGIGQLDAIDARSRRLERRIDRAVASFPLRTMLSLRRGLHRMLK
jgi:SAM-dependent methyltransferase